MGEPPNSILPLSAMKNLHALVGYLAVTALPFAFALPLAAGDIEARHGDILVPAVAPVITFLVAAVIHFRLSLAESGIVMQLEY